MRDRLQILCVLAVALTSFAGSAAVDPARTTITLASGFDMQVLTFPAQGRQLLIWIPSAYGIREGNAPFAEAVQQQGIDYWLVDLHDSYMAPTGRSSYADFEPQHVKELIDHAVREGWQNIYLGGESRGAALAMRAARQWQIDNPGDAALKGMVFIHPFLVDGHTEIGEQARFHPIARSTNLPVYILQPEFNTKYLHSRELIDQLESGGAPVYFHFLEGVRGGFHVRDADLLSARETEERNLVGQRIRTALDVLADLPPPARAAVQSQDPVPHVADGADDGSTLVPVRRDAAVPLRLHDGQGRTVDIEDYRGKVVLVNFWATWCGPCVKEIASLMRLIEHFEGRPFQVLAVNISESPAQVTDFFESRDIRPNFQVLYDRDGSAAKAWRVYAVPSTYLLDKGLDVRYGYRGALKWDKPSVVETVDELLE